jgi:hypothetical protein
VAVGRFGSLPSQFGRSARENTSDRVVELSDARETRGERSVGERDVGGLYQDPCGFGTTRSGESLWSRPQLAEQQTMEVPFSDVKSGREAGHPFPVHDTVTDESHGASRDVCADAPFR